MTRWFVYKWGKPIWQKFHRVILRLLLSRIHYYQNKWLQVKESQYFISTYSWTLILIPNWTYSVVVISHFQCMDLSTWLTNRCADLNTWLDYQLEKYVSCKVLQFITRWRSWNSLVTKSVYKHSSFFKRKMNNGKFCFRSQFAWTQLCFTLVQLCNLWRPLK